LTEDRARGRGKETSTWGSEESRDFLQERIRRFSGTVLVITAAFFLAGWAIAVVWSPEHLVRGMPLAPMHLLNLGGIATYLVMWLATRGQPLPGPVLHMVDGGGVILACVLETFMCFQLPIALRPDLLGVVLLFGLLLYRAAIVPSDPRRTAWIGALAAAPLPVITYFAYSRAALPGLPQAGGYTIYAALFGLLAVLLSTKISGVIYGLRQTVREARRLGPYTLVEKIGEGGMGAVYRASHSLLRRPTAIKILPPQRAGEMDLARFEREVQMTSQLTSPHTVSVYDYGRTPDGLFYYAMEFLDGIDLEELVRRDGPMPPARVAHVLRQVCEALGEAHRAGLIHRDVKPANILLCERGGRFDVAKVVDFGLVKSVAGGEPGVTQENMAPGTPHYMAPEALRSPDRLDARSDVYSLGATAYFLLTGRPVFEGGLAEVLAQLMRETPPAPSARLGRSLPSRFDALVLAALAKSPEDRPGSVEAFAAGLTEAEAAVDGDAWSAAKAEAWWRDRGAEIRASRSGGRPATRRLASHARHRARGRTLKREDEPRRHVGAQDEVVRARDGLDGSLDPSLERGAREAERRVADARREAAGLDTGSERRRQEGLEADGDGARPVALSSGARVEDGGAEAGCEVGTKTARGEVVRDPRREEVDVELDGRQGSREHEPGRDVGPVELERPPRGGAPARAQAVVEVVFDGGAGTGRLAVPQVPAEHVPDRRRDLDPRIDLSEGRIAQCQSCQEPEESAQAVSPHRHTAAGSLSRDLYHGSVAGSVPSPYTGSHRRNPCNSTGGEAVSRRRFSRSWCSERSAPSAFRPSKRSRGRSRS
jgi:serine/threonine-protein kinase